MAESEIPDDDFINLYTGFLQQGPPSLLLPMQITNLKNQKKIILNAIIDTGLPEFLIISDKMRAQLGINPDKSQLKEVRAYSVDATLMKLIAVHDVEIQIEIPLLKMDEPWKFYKQAQPLDGFFLLPPGCDDPEPVVGIQFLEAFNFDILLTEMFIPGVRSYKCLISTVLEDIITPWEGDPITPEFLEALKPPKKVSKPGKKLT